MPSAALSGHGATDSHCQRPCASDFRLLFQVKVKKLGDGLVEHTSYSIPLRISQCTSSGGSPCVTSFPTPTIVRISKVTGKPVRKYERKVKSASTFSWDSPAVDLADNTAHAGLVERITTLVDAIHDSTVPPTTAPEHGSSLHHHCQDLPCFLPKEKRCPNLQ